MEFELEAPMTKDQFEELHKRLEAGCGVRLAMRSETVDTAAGDRVPIESFSVGSLG